MAIEKLKNNYKA